jgi:hypothetical protein
MVIAVGTQQATFKILTRTSKEGGVDVNTEKTN